VHKTASAENKSTMLKGNSDLYGTAKQHQGSIRAILISAFRSTLTVDIKSWMHWM
jgi:DUF1680 family protein